MQNLKDQLLCAGFASEEQVQKAEEGHQQKLALIRFKETGELRDFLAAYPIFRAGLGRGFPPDMPVFISEKSLKDEIVYVREPDRGKKLETGYGSPLCGITLVVGIKETGETARFPTNLSDSGTRAGKIGQGNFRHFALVDQREDHIAIYVSL